MQQNDNNNKDSADKAESIEDWRNEHGKPSFKYLQSLANDGNPGSLEKLRSIAQDLDVDFGPNTPTDVLVRKILATQSDSNTTT